MAKKGYAMRKKKAKNMTDERINKICESLKKGATSNAAARSVGLNLNTFNSWLLTGERESLWRQKGRKENPELDGYVDFYDRVMKTLGELEGDLSNTIVQASKRERDGDWKAAAWMLERRFDWKNKTVIDANITNLNPKDQLKRKLGLIEERIDNGEDTRKVSSDEDS